MQIATRLQSCLNPHPSVLARLGSDEFVLILLEQDAEAAMQMIDALECEVDEIRVRPNDSEYTIPVNLWSGMAVVPGDAEISRRIAARR